MRITSQGVAMALAMALIPAARAEDPAALFDQLFAARLKAAQATRLKTDDAALAATIVEAAQSLTQDKAIQLYFAEKACDLASPIPEAQATAIAAAKLMAVADPARAADSRDRVLKLLKSASLRGTPEERKKAAQLFIHEAVLAGDTVADEDPAEATSLYRQALTAGLSIKDPDVKDIRLKIEALAAKAGVAQRITALRERLLADATDKATAVSLVELYVVEQDAPGAAGKVLTLTQDPALIANVTAAQRPVADLSEAEALALAEWYHGLAAKSSAVARPVMLRRSVSAYGRFLALHSAQDTARLKAGVTVQAIERELAPPPTAATVAAVTPAQPVKPPTGATGDDKDGPAGLPYRLKDYAIAGPLQMTGTKGPYLIESWMRVTAGEHINIDVGPGVEIKGGTINLERHGHLRIKGEPNKPVVLRDVVIIQDLSASFTAEHAVFENVTFTKGGGWFAGFSSKWVFANCILHKCRFPRLTEVDYGFQFRNCSFTFMTFPEAGGPSRHEWRVIDSCNFIGCDVPPTIGWCAVKSNFYACTFPAGEKWKGATGLTAEPYLFKTKGPPPQFVWLSEPAAAKVTVTPAAKAYEVFKFPVKPAIAELRGDRTTAGILFE